MSRRCGQQHWQLKAQVPLSALSDVAGIIAFFDGYVRFQTPPKPQLLPEGVQSPAKTLATRSGSALDMAVLAASLLLGQGFHAYVVIGLARQSI